MTTNPSDPAWMARAIRLARRGLRTTHPNPRVGCVVVAGGEVVGEGWHERAGEPHAEVIALERAGGRARGATVYLNLEPCCHQGRTPPCTDALIDGGVARVVAAMEDPNPQVGGGGVQVLRSAGIDVDIGLMRETAAALNRGFVTRMQRGRPWITIKTAASLDGRTAMANGESQWITSEAARADVHRLRARSSAILTGSRTARTDNPLLTARCRNVTRQPVRVLVDGNLQVDPDMHLFDDTAPVVVATAVDPAERRYGANVDVVRMDAGHGRVDLVGLMRHLAEREINELLVEAGSSLNGALLKNNLVDEIVLYMAPKLLGSGAEGMYDLPFVSNLDQHIALDVTDVRRVGPDLRMTALVKQD